MLEKVAEVIQYEDTNDNGYFNKITNGYDGVKIIDRSDSLLELGVDEVGTAIDVTILSWDDLRKENAKYANTNWQHAQRLFTTAFKYGFVDKKIIGLSKASSVQEKHSKAFWLKERILRKLLAIAPQEMHKELLRAYYNNDQIEMDKVIQRLKY